MISSFNCNICMMKYVLRVASIGRNDDIFINWGKIHFLTWKWPKEDENIESNLPWRSDAKFIGTATDQLEKKKICILDCLKKKAAFAFTTDGVCWELLPSFLMTRGSNSTSCKQIKNVIYWYLAKIKQNSISGPKRGKTIPMGLFQGHICPLILKDHMLFSHMKNTLLRYTLDNLKPGDQWCKTRYLKPQNFLMWGIRFLQDQSCDQKANCINTHWNFSGL